ncbi:Homeodomain-like protein [Polychytrium aggregatum]|uniref:Homeodomain-like protein n=1 Tax=Polychytrium aggregatum TaxID=110093 RepID=UPI0022FE89BD|nr:Homeodomain-like protein [Polychytrium aggregatum]KAI9202626.1 Homeodomain-like protein [Polychytrium aggregatum]
MSLVSPIVAPSRSNSSSSAASPDLAATHLASRKRSFAKVAEPALTPGSPLAESSDASEAAFSPSASSRRSSKKRRSDFHAPIYRRWTHQEDALLRNAVAEFGSKSNWAKVAQQVPGRSAMQCSTRWSGALNPAIKKGKWTKESDESLIAAYTKAVEAVGGNKEAVNWSSIAECVPGRTGVQCMARYLEALDPSVRKGKWGAEEDQLLRTGLKELGLRWVELAKRIPGRTQRQCRTRWIQIRDTLSEDGGRYYSRPSKRKKTSRDSAAWPGSVRASHADLLSTDTTSMELHPECDIYAEIKAESPDEPSSWDVGASDSFSDSFGDDTDLPPTSVSQQNSQLYFYSGSSDMPSLMMDGI